jgi:hypothetical protein
MSSTKDEKQSEAPMDVRMLERMLKRGQMTRKEYERLCKQAPDAKAKAAPLAGQPPSTDD